MTISTAKSSAESCAACEPEKQEGVTRIRNYYDGNEFIKSTDPYFRPVDQTTAPDGTVYITDLYHGIIQEATWARPGTYLRARIQQYDLDKVIHKGRIWRLVYDGVMRIGPMRWRATRPCRACSTRRAPQLLAHLAHPNGWWRDTAQQLLVLKQDKSVVPLLQERLRVSNNLLEKFHVLWTLEGLSALDAASVRREMADARTAHAYSGDSRERDALQGGRSIVRRRLQAADNRPERRCRHSGAADDEQVEGAGRGSDDQGRRRCEQGRAACSWSSTAILNPPAAGGRAAAVDAAVRRRTRLPSRRCLDRGAQIYGELCFSCHGADGYGAPRPGDASGATMAPRLAGSPRVNGHRDYVIKAVLHGMTGPLDGVTYTDVMIPNQSNPDDWVAAVTSYVRNNFGNSGGFVSAADVARVRAATSSRRTPWTVTELEASLPKLLDQRRHVEAVGEPQHRGRAARADDDVMEQPGRRRRPACGSRSSCRSRRMVTEIQFTSTGGGRGGGGGGGGRDGSRGRSTSAPPGPPPNTAIPRGYKVETSLNGTTWTLAAEGSGSGPSTTDHVPPGAGEVRANDADGGRRRRATLVDSAVAVVRSLCAGCTLRHGGMA